MKYAQLSTEAKAHARAWWVEGETDDWSSTRAPDALRDIDRCLQFLGIELGRDRNSDFRVEWTEFCIQGGGFRFGCSWSASQVDLGGLMAYAPKDETLRGIGVQLMALVLRWPLARVETGLIYYGGARLPDIVILESLRDDFSDDEEPELPHEEHDQLITLMHRIGDWCYQLLKDNYEYDTSDKAAEESIEANDYDFDENGKVQP